MPFLKLEVNWGNLGWLDETPYLRDHDVKWGWGDSATPIILHPVAPVGIARFTMRNDTGRYTPTFTSSVWQPEIIIGRRVRLSRTYTKDNGQGYSLPLWEGFLYAIEPDTGQYSKSDVVLVCKDWLEPLTRAHFAFGYLGSKEVDDAISQLISKAVTSLGENLEDNNDAIFDYGAHWQKDKDTVYSAIEDICRSFQGRFHVGQNGYYNYVARGTLDNAPANSIDLQAHVIGAKINYSDKPLINRATLTVHPYNTTSTTNIVLWSSATVLTVAANDEREITARFRDPATGQYVSAKSVVALTATTDYVINGAADGSGTDYTGSGSITITKTNETNGAIINIENNLGVRIYFTLLQVRGKAIYAYDEIIVTRQDATSITAYGLYEVALDLTCQFDDEEAWAYAQRILDWFSDPRWYPRSVTLPADTEIVSGQWAYTRHIMSWFKLFDANTISSMAVRVVGGRYWSRNHEHLITYYLEPYWSHLA